MFDDDESVFDRLWGIIRERFRFIGRLLGFIKRLWDFIVPVWIIKRPESLTILDYRPTLTMLLTSAGLLAAALSFVLVYFNVNQEWASILWILAAPGLVSIFFLFRATIREVYYFDKTTDSYRFVRQFIHRREVIEGALSQFTGAYVKTVSEDESESYFVVLQQEGMFLTGVSEQVLREDVPISNSFERESLIANAIAGYLPSKR